MILGVDIYLQLLSANEIISYVTCWQDIISCSQPTGIPRNTHCVLGIFILIVTYYVFTYYVNKLNWLTNLTKIEKVSTINNKKPTKEETMKNTGLGINADSLKEEINDRIENGDERAYEIKTLLDNVDDEAINSIIISTNNMNFWDKYNELISQAITEVADVLEQ